MSRILVIDDDRSVRHLIAKAFEDTDVEVVPAATAEEGMRLLGEAQSDVVLLDILLPESSGLDLFEQIRTADPKLPVIFITSLSSSDTAIKAMTLGAFDYLLKPLDLARIRDLVRQATGNSAADEHSCGDAWCAKPCATTARRRRIAATRSSATVRRCRKCTRRSAASRRRTSRCLIRGESGTGKELVARALYQHSPRVKGQFLAVNCAAIPDALLESELFGHEKGSFTGADQRRIGKFEQCSGGTLFLDEIGDMSPLVQSKVLRVLQSQQFERVGGNQTITHRRPRHRRHQPRPGKNGRGRRVPLRSLLPVERLHDSARAACAIGPRIWRRCSKTIWPFSARSSSKDVHGISPEAMEVLLNYSWPGNVRELQNVLKQTLASLGRPRDHSRFHPGPNSLARRRLRATAAATRPEPICGTSSTNGSRPVRPISTPKRWSSWSATS